MIEADILFFSVFQKKDGREEHDPEGLVFSPEGARPTPPYFIKTTALPMK